MVTANIGALGLQQQVHQSGAASDSQPAGPEVDRAAGTSHPRHPASPSVSALPLCAAATLRNAKRVDTRESDVPAVKVLAIGASGD